MMEVCQRCASLVNRKFYNKFEIDELVNVGYLRLLSIDTDKLEPRQIHSNAYYYMLCYCQREIQKRTYKFEREDFRKQSLSVSHNADTVLDILEKMALLSPDEQKILIDYILMDNTQVELCKVYNKNNQSSIRYLLIKAKAKLKKHMKGYGNE